MALPFEPETVESALLRFKDALKPDYDVEEVARHPENTPGKLRKHVFDFPDGVRMIASVDRWTTLRTLHLSFSLDTPSKPAELPSFAWFSARVSELCWQFGGSLPLESHTTKVAVHFWFNLPHEAN